MEALRPKKTESYLRACIEQKLIETELAALMKKKRRYIERNREAGNTQLVNDYFSPQPLYPDHIFRRQFRMNKDMFIRIVNALENHSIFFQNRCDAAGRMSLTPLQKCTAAIRQLTYSVPADHLDEYLQMGETTMIECMSKFCQCIIKLFEAQYLRRKNVDDTQLLIQMHEERHGFPESPLFTNVLSGNASSCNFEANGTLYTKGYYLTDGIYPKWSTFVKSFSCPLDAKRKKFKEMQETARKDVERAFGVLQARWAIIKGSAKQWYKDNLKEIMLTCIILHNMIVEDEVDHVTNWDDDTVNSTQFNNVAPQAFEEYIQRS